MATTAMCTSFKGELPQAIHNFTASSGNVFWMLLIKVAPSLTYGASQTNVGTPGTGTPTTANVGTDEVTGTGYVSGGFDFTAAQNTTPSVVGGTTAFWSWGVNPSWTSATFSATAGIIYNATSSNRSVGVFDFGGTQSVTSGTFTVVLPSNTNTTAILRIA